MMDKVKMFKKELELIEDDEIRGLIETCLRLAPGYFFSIPASSTGKYHPKYALGEGGLVRHTKAAVKIANDLLNLEQYNHLNKTQIISALILHDIVKKGRIESNHTVFEHPKLAAEFLMEVYLDSEISSMKVARNVDEICKLIKSHMGQWNTNKHSDSSLPKPTGEGEQFVHLCDYLASRKYLECIL